MRIRAFSKNVEFYELENYHLKNCSVVIDGHNYFYYLYQMSGLPFQFGCESDKYADYLRDHLSMFMKAKVKCYVVFKGGHADEKNRIKDDGRVSDTYDTNEPEVDFVSPVFMKAVYKEVLEELGINYVICQFESKKDCIALAQTLKCPIISYDIEFCFSGVPYIPRQSLNYESRTHSIRCGIFKLRNYMYKYGMYKEKLALFIVLTDEHIFPAQSFQSLFERQGINFLNPFTRNQHLVNWLTKNKEERIFKMIFEFLSSEEILKFEDEYKKIYSLIARVETPGEAVKYLMDGCVSFEENDPCWFEKGVITNNIAAPYVNPYHSKGNVVSGSWCIEDLEADDSMFLSIDVIKYAFNLLTNYQKDYICFFNNKCELQILSAAQSVQKPVYQAVSSPFENGWDRIKSLRLFEHFLEESLPDVSFVHLHNLPKDARILMITLVYYSRRKAVDTTRQVYSILLSFVMLGAVFPRLNDPTCKNSECYKDMLVDDCQKTVSILEPFFKLSRSDLREIFDRKLIHAFVEFQHCLRQMNYLNKLCGQCFEPTVYQKTYNGTFVYRVFYSIKNDSGEEALNTIKNMLMPAPTVLSFFMTLVSVFEQTMSS